MATVLALAGLVWLPAAHAEDPGALSLTKSVTGWSEGQEVAPGEEFVYTITITCSNLGSGGCTNAVLTDPLPDGIILDPDGTVGVVGATADVDTSGGDVTVTFTDPLADPPGSQGLPDGSTVTVQIPVQVDPDIPATRNGEPLTNVAVVDGTNTEPDDDDFTVVPNIPLDLASTTSKSFVPDSAVASPGTGTTLSVAGGNASNVPVDSITVVDPTDPSASPNPFAYLALTGVLVVTLPPGAEQVQVDAWVGGAWVPGTPGPPPAALPGGVDPATVTGIRITFISTDADPIPAGTSGSVDLDLVQRDNVAEAGEGPIDNTVSATVSVDDQTSDATTADDSYVLTSPDLPLDVTKDFDPDTIVVGGESTVLVTATNTSDRTLDSLTITEPSSDPNPFESGLTFAGWTDEVVWPTGATGATVTYTLASGDTVSIDTTAVDTLPDPPAGADVVGFTVEFTGPITSGAEARVPFTVVADEDQGPEEVEHPNEVAGESTAPGGFTGEDTDSDVLTTIKRRLSVTTDKRIVPDQIFSIPGQLVTVLLSGRVDPFPASTADATEIVVQDPADLDTDAWYDYFRPTTIAETPIPAGSSLTVQYWDGTQWVDVPGMVDLEGPQIFTADLPPEVVENARGIRFVYQSDDGFPPGTEVTPNLNFELRPEAAGEDLEVENCDSTTASSPRAPTATDTLTDCPVITLVPPTPGNADFIDKAWDAPKLVGERTGEEAGATIRWSTSGASDIPQVNITDVPDASVATLPDSVYDVFDLVRIDPVTPALDPHLTFDQVVRVELYSLSSGGWVTPADDPCPEACDGTFPGYALSADQQEDTIAFRLFYRESPTRADRIGGDPTAPPVGSGVARSTGNDRQVHPVFRIRDDLRSDPTVPVVSDAVFNVEGEPSEVRNTARFSVVIGGQEYVNQDASDVITIAPVPVTVTLDKTWSGGPLGVPPEGTPFPEDWPTGRVTLDAFNTTPREIDRLAITDPAVGIDPFDAFNLRGLVDVTDPGTIGATDVTITLELAGGGTRVLTRDQALAATEAELADVVGLSVVYTGRIEEGAHAIVVFDTRLRPTLRSDGSPVEPGQTIEDRALTVAEDLVDYPGTVPVVSVDSDIASIDLFEIGIGLDVTKSFDPAEQTEPDRSPVTMTLTGQPSGPSRTTTMVITDVDPSFWNQYDVVELGSSFAFASPIDQVRVDVLTGGTFVASGGGVTLEGADWVEGIPGDALALPDDVTPADVQGLRFTFTREDGQIWENPATPLQEVPVVVQRRETLRTGGPVPSDLAGNSPAPGEELAGEATNDVSGENTGADLVGGEPIRGTDEAEASILYRHARNAVEVTKTPGGARPPGVTIPYTLTFTNTGDVAVVDPVITDRLPSDADGPLVVLNPETTDHYTFSLEGAAPTPPNGPALPTDPEQVTITESPTLITFEFPPGTVLEIGQTYTITVDLVFRDGLPGTTDVTNTTGISGERPWDGCIQTLDQQTGECQASTTVNPTGAGAIRGTKSVRAVDDELGVLDTRDTGCTSDAEGFYRGGCVPVTKPGSDEVWRLEFRNTGNLPLDRLYSLDRLPVVGDTGAIVDLPRDSEFRPLPQSLTYVRSVQGAASAIRVYHDPDDTLCTDDLDGVDCPPGAWTLVGETTDPPDGWTVDLPVEARALKVEIEYDDQLLQPTGATVLDLRTTTPSQAPARTADPIAWNTVAQAGRTNDGGSLALAPKSEGNKVGVALATGPIEVRKLVIGPAQEYAPDTFTLGVSCTSAGQDVDLGEDATLTLTPPQTALLENLPWGAECTVSEDSEAVGATDFLPTTVTVGRSDEPTPVLLGTNVYADAGLVIEKEVSDSAFDAQGNPVSYGPFTFDVECTFLGEPVFADGYGPDDPMTAAFRSGESVAFTQLPAGSECTATESDTGGADDTSSTGTTGDGAVQGDASIDLVLTEDTPTGRTTNTVTFDNTFGTGRLNITKVVDGDGAAIYGAGPFVLRLTCTEGPDDRVVWDGDITLGGGDPLTRTVEDLWAGADCSVTETATGGANGVVITPSGTFPVTAGSTVTVTVTNTFTLGRLRVVKQISGAGASEVPDDRSFRVRLTCTRTVDGATVPVAIPGDGERELSREDGLVTTYEALPVGAACEVTEPDDGGADDTSVVPSSLVVGSEEVAEFVVTNTYDEEEVGPGEGGGGGTEGAGGSPSVGPTAQTGGEVVGRSAALLVGALAAGLVCLLGTLLLLRRRSRQQPA